MTAKTLRIRHAGVSYDVTLVPPPAVELDPRHTPEQVSEAVTARMAAFYRDALSGQLPVDLDADERTRQAQRRNIDQLANELGAQYGQVAQQAAAEALARHHGGKR